MEAPGAFVGQAAQPGTHMNLLDLPELGFANVVALLDMPDRCCLRSTSQSLLNAVDKVNHTVNVDLNYLPASGVESFLSFMRRLPNVRVLTIYSTPLVANVAMRIVDEIQTQHHVQCLELHGLGAALPKWVPLIPSKFPALQNLKVDIGSKVAEHTGMEMQIWVQDLTKQLPPSLTDLSLSSEGPATVCALGHLSGLRALSLGCIVAEELPPNLTSLTVDSCRATLDAVALQAGVEGAHLDLVLAHLGRDATAGLVTRPLVGPGRAACLKRLVIDGTVTDSDWQALAALPLLSDLRCDMHDSGFSVNTPAAARGRGRRVFPALRSLCLTTSGPVHSPDALAVVAADLTGLHALTIRSQFNEQGFNMRSLQALTSLTGLTSLRTHSNWCRQWCGAFPGLQELRAYCDLDSEDLLAIARGLPALQRLHLYTGELRGGELLMRLAAKPRLHELYVVMTESSEVHTEVVEETLRIFAPRVVFRAFTVHVR